MARRRRLGPGLRRGPSVGLRGPVGRVRPRRAAWPSRAPRRSSRHGALLGPQLVGLHSAGRWLVVDPAGGRGHAHLAVRPRGARSSGPGATAVAGVRPRRPRRPAARGLAARAARRSPSPPRRPAAGLTFVARAPRAAPRGRGGPSRRRGTPARSGRVVAWLGLGLGFVALFQLASGLRADLRLSSSPGRAPSSTVPSSTGTTSPATCSS